MKMLIGSMVIFGTIGIFRKYIPLSSSLLACFRGLVGSIFLMGVVKLRKEKIMKPIEKMVLCLLIVSGSMIGINWILLFEAYRYTTVSVATLCYYMAPVIVIVCSPIKRN